MYFLFFRCVQSLDVVKRELATVRPHLDAILQVKQIQYILFKILCICMILLCCILSLFGGNAIRLYLRSALEVSSDVGNYYSDAAILPCHLYLDIVNSAGLLSLYI